MADLLGVPKEIFIESIRQDLGKITSATNEAHDSLHEDIKSLERRAQEVRTRLSTNQNRLIEKLAKVADLRGWKVHQPSNIEAAQSYIRDLVERDSVAMALRSDQDIFDIVTLDDMLQGLGVELLIMAHGRGSTDYSKPAAADLGITGVDYAIAETGTAVLLPRKGLSRLVSLLPPLHLVLVRPSEILETLDDLYLLRRLAYYQNEGEMGSYMNFITGPSRTADIEQTLVVGAHGPKEVHMVILGEG